MKIIRATILTAACLTMSDTRAMAGTQTSSKIKATAITSEPSLAQTKLIEVRASLRNQILAAKDAETAVTAQLKKVTVLHQELESRRIVESKLNAQWLNKTSDAQLLLDLNQAKIDSDFLRTQMIDESVKFRTLAIRHDTECLKQFITALQLASLTSTMKDRVTAEIDAINGISREGLNANITLDAVSDTGRAIRSIVLNIPLTWSEIDQLNFIEYHPLTDSEKVSVPKTMSDVMTRLDINAAPARSKKKFVIQARELSSLMTDVEALYKAIKELGATVKSAKTSCENWQEHRTTWDNFLVTLACHASSILAVDQAQCQDALSPVSDAKYALDKALSDSGSN